MSVAAEPLVKLTDPKQLPKSDRCPRCGAKPDVRVKSAGFGSPHDVCGKCGFEFALEDSCD